MQSASRHWCAPEHEIAIALSSIPVGLCGKEGKLCDCRITAYTKVVPTDENWLACKCPKLTGSSLVRLGKRRTAK
jgi:hypothetical protein